MQPKGFHRKLAAILSADVAGYSSLMRDDEAATVKTLEAYKQIISARLESISDPGGICVSKTAIDHNESKLPLGYEYLGNSFFMRMLRQKRRFINVQAHRSA